MDTSKEALLLIGTSFILLLVFLLVVLAVMIIYRKRRMEHLREISLMNEQFLRELLQTRVEVMQNIGSEIHDNVGQQINVASLHLQQLLAEAPHNQDGIAHVRKLLTQALRDLRTLARHLSNEMYRDVDLHALIRNECEKVNNTGICKVTCRSDQDHIEASEAAKTFVLRIVQEFLQNSLKHARCTEIGIQISQHDDRLVISAQDNGVGFQPTAGETGIGLMTMQRRAQLLGARLEVASGPGEGTRMKLFLPTAKINL